MASKRDDKVYLIRKICIVYCNTSQCEGAVFHAIRRSMMLDCRPFRPPSFAVSTYLSSKFETAVFNGSKHQSASLV